MRCAGTQRQLRGFTGQMGSSANLRGLQGSGGSGTPAGGASGRNSGGAQGLDGAMDRHASLQSLRSVPQGAPDRLLQKIESMASTAVRAAAKIKVSSRQSLHSHPYPHPQMAHRRPLQPDAGGWEQATRTQQSRLMTCLRERATAS